MTKHLVYIDEWEGKYTLWEHNSCCDLQKPVMLVLVNEGTNKYEWKLFVTDNSRKDTVFGEAKYVRNKLKFFVNNGEVANSYFMEEISPGKAVFNMEYDNYYTENEKLYIGYFTRWNIFLRGYKNSGSLFSGISHHFKRMGREHEKLVLTKEELKNKKINRLN